ncbi:MAG: hypothetical protein HY852_13690 [Bradyrhizobium sp.]|uniref:hypothetical protein n=1 Tax=Bradyrhizobium sp. TaxID=376 RepID=UPI0025BC8C19|nr:hypothetical protein [Bradyrhizobium sp.]MBI5262860.1 hypothetical protein [Bradyrhizobium sp.]
MKLRGWMIGTLMLGASVPLALAQSDMRSPSSSSSEQYVPRLGDIMSGVQARHVKLWFAGKAQNWGLAEFELRQLKAGLTEAALLYSGIPVTNVTTLDGPLTDVSDAISAKDGRKFAKAMSGLTDGCNGCHQSMGRGFIAIRIPTQQQPFGNQQFAPQR